METTDLAVKPAYERPKITVLDPDEVLRVFQVTASQISAAGCWWSSDSWQ